MNYYSCIFVAKKFTFSKFSSCAKTNLMVEIDNPVKRSLLIVELEWAFTSCSLEKLLTADDTVTGHHKNDSQSYCIIRIDFLNLVIVNVYEIFVWRTI